MGHGVGLRDSLIWFILQPGIKDSMAYEAALGTCVGWKGRFNGFFEHTVYINRGLGGLLCSRGKQSDRLRPDPVAMYRVTQVQLARSKSCAKSVTQMRLLRKPTQLSRSSDWEGCCTEVTPKRHLANARWTTFLARLPSGRSTKARCLRPPSRNYHHNPAPPNANLMCKAAAKTRESHRTAMNIATPARPITQGCQPGHPIPEVP